MCYASTVARLSPAQPSPSPDAFYFHPALACSDRRRSIRDVVIDCLRLTWKAWPSRTNTVCLCSYCQPPLEASTHCSYADCYVVFFGGGRVQASTVLLLPREAEDPPLPHRKDTLLVMRTIDENEARRVSKNLFIHCVSKATLKGQNT